MLDTRCTCTKLRRAARRLTEIYDEALRESGLTVAQFSLLRTIGRLGQPNISAIAEATGLDRSTLGRNLQPLLAQGLVEPVVSGDRRSRAVRLSEAGESRIAAALPAWERSQARIDARIGAEGRRTLFAVLGEIETLAA